MLLLRVLHDHLVRLGQWVINILRGLINPYPQPLIVGAMTDLGRTKRELMLENAMLRQQLIVASR